MAAKDPVSPSSPAALKEAIRHAALAQGFDVARFAEPRAAAHGAYFQQWLAAGRHGEMAWLARDPHLRLDPAQWLPEAQSILVLGVNYAPTGAREGVIAHYARNEDYHRVIHKRLRALRRAVEELAGPGVVLKACVDSAPLMEKPLASTCGVGWQGKNTLLVSRHFGCWLFLAELPLSLPLPADEAEGESCGDCVRCLVACPTGALWAPFRLDASRCISYLTIEHRGAIPMDLRRAIGQRIYGCDACLLPCPLNRFAPPSPHGAFQSQAEPWSLGSLSALDEGGFHKAFQGTPVKRMGWERFSRNLAVALGNWGDPLAIPALARLLHHDSPLVRGHGAWGLGQVAGENAWHLLQEAKRREEDPFALQEMESALTAQGLACKRG